MERLECGIKASFTEEEGRLIRFWAEQSGQKPAEWVRSQVVKALHVSGPSEIQIVLAEVCGMGTFLAKCMAELSVIAMGGDEEAGVGKVLKFFDEAMNGKHAEAAKLLSKKDVADPKQGAIVEASKGGINGTDPKEGAGADEGKGNEVDHIRAVNG